MSEYSGEQNIDRWTGMPLEFEDIEYEPAALSVEAPAGRRSERFDFGSLIWKFFASGSAVTPGSVLSVLSTDEREQIRRRCGENPNTPADALALLAEDRAESVRIAVARNRHTPLFVLRRLSHDSNAEVRLAIASNPEMPDAILLSLFMDPDPCVADRASQTMAA